MYWVPQSPPRYHNHDIMIQRAALLRGKMVHNLKLTLPSPLLVGHSDIESLRAEHIVLNLKLPTPKAQNFRQMVAVRRGRTATAAEAPVTKRTSSSPSPIRTLRNKSGAPVILPPTVSTPQPTAQELVPLWARVWLAISITIVLWDAAYVLCRPLSFYPTGSLGMSQQQQSRLLLEIAY